MERNKKPKINEINEEELIDDQEEPEELEEESKEEEFDLEMSNEKFDKIIKNLEAIDVEKEIGEKEKIKETRIVIEKIELENFKSWAGLKKIYPLHNRFNAVVGPNGSGKSNLMESMLFVFGKRAKRMRLNKLSELIHHSTTMKDLRFASVTIYLKEIRDLENDGFEDIPNSQFILSREVYKNSSSKYLLNHQEITFEKLCSILDKKGIDLKHNRFLILQGEVEQISMMKPKAVNAGDTGLLEFLEDIIGTSRYVNVIEKFGKSIDDLSEIKQQKTNRLKHLKNELDQLEDIKNNATDYYKKEKQQFLLINLEKMLSRYEVNLELEKMNTKLSEYERNVEEVEKKKNQKISEQTTTLEEIKKLRAKIQNIEKELKAREAKIEELDEVDRVKRSEIENISKNILKIKTSLEKSNRNYASFSESILKANSDLPNKEAELDQLKKLKEKLEKVVNERESEIYETTQKSQIRKRDLEARLEPYETKINQNKFTIEQNNSTISLLSENTNKFTHEMSALQTEQQKLNSSIEVKKSNLEAYNTKQTEIATYLQNVISELKTVQASEEQIFKQFSQLQSKISEIKHSNSERIQRNANLDALMRAQNQGQLNGIYGRLGDLGSIETEYDVAISTSCSHLNSIVVEKVEHATKAVEFLRANNLGRMTFIVMEKQLELESRMHNFREVPECRRLFDLVKINNQRLSPAFYFALKDTLVCKDLNTASKIAYGVQRHRIVTLNGELIETSGTMSGGGKPKKGGMSNKPVDDGNTADYLNKLLIEYEEGAKEYKNKRNERLALEDKRNMLSQNIQEIKLAKNQIENELGMQEKQTSDYEKKINSMKKEIEKLNKNTENIKKLQLHNQELEKSAEELIKESTEFRKELENIEDEINKISGEDHKKNKEELKNFKKNLDNVEKAIHNYRNIIENAPTQIQKLKEEIETKEKFITQNEGLIEKIKKDMEEIEKYAEETYGQIEILNREKNNMNSSDSEVSKAIGSLRNEIAKINDEKEKIIAEMNEVKIEYKKLEKKEQNIEDEINKNKINFKKFMEEYGFIDEFENEINKINSQKEDEAKYDENKMIIEAGNGINNINEEEVNENKKQTDKKENINIMILDEQSEDGEEIDINIIEDKRPKIPKVGHNYKKYIDQKYFNYRFKAVELEDLYKFKNEIFFEKATLNSAITQMKPNLDSIILYKNKLIDLKSKESDFDITVQRLQNAKNAFDTIKDRRYKEFMEGYNMISSKLKEMYQLITNGGDAEFELVDSLDPFSEGINFTVRPPKKSWKQISNLSGGEKTLSSLSLIFALHHYKPSPLYVMDEIDAALDFKNVSIIANYIKEQTRNSQFIIISLRNHMFELANRLIGIFKTKDITQCLTYMNEKEESTDKNEDKYN